MAFNEPRRWYYWLPLSEWWYNTTYHTSLQVTPFQALYGFPPPLINEISIPGPEDKEVRDFLAEKETMLQHLKDNLIQSQNRIKKYADKQRSEREFEIGDLVYLRMQPYRVTAFGLRHSLKLTTKYYGSFIVMQKIGKAAYKLQLPEGEGIHLVFHVSQLKSTSAPMRFPVQIFQWWATTAR